MKFFKLFSKVNERIMPYISSVLTATLAISWLMCYCFQIFGIELNYYLLFIYIVFIFVVMGVIICFIYKKISSTSLDSNRIRNCCDKTLRNVMELSHNPLKYFKVVLVEELMQYEKDARKNVWILTADLRLERDESVRNIMKNNIRNGKKYLYFLPDDKEFKINVETLFDDFLEEKDNIEIYYLNIESNSFLLPKFDVVIYDPMTKYRQGYCCVGLNDKQEKILYRKMSDNEMNTIMNRLIEVTEKQGRRGE